MFQARRKKVLYFYRFSKEHKVKKVVILLPHVPTDEKIDLVSILSLSRVK